MTEQLSPDEIQRRLLKLKFESKIKKILKRKLERNLTRQEELLKEQQLKDRKIQRFESINENYTAQLKSPYIRDDDVEYEFDNIYQEFEDEQVNRKTKITGMRMSQTQKQFYNKDKLEEQNKKLSQKYLKRYSPSS